MNNMILDLIQKPNDIKKVNKEDYNELADEIRECIIENVSTNGGHLSSSLGVVELTMALHLTMNLPKDKILWDVGHQAYAHKILTGRKEAFNTLRQLNGLSGFPSLNESKCDAFGMGHASTSISAALGYVKARELSKDNYTVVSVIGDGALTGGMAYEALNNASLLKSNMIIILNDNEMSISRNVGGISKVLNTTRTSARYNELKDNVKNTLSKIPGYGEDIIGRIHKTKSSIKQLFVPGMIFEDMGLTYLGPIDGHNIERLVKTINMAKKVNHAVVIHVHTTKGKGYPFAERKPSFFHGVDPFDIETGKPVSREKVTTYSDIFSSSITSMAEKDDKVVAITAAMGAGTGLKKFERNYPDRFFDVGIAEEHAVTFAAGLASAGYKPYVAIYSTFLQRGFDQILHDVCIQKLPVRFIVERAGIVGKDGITHQGIFDISYLNIIPGMTIMAPKNKYELRDMLDFSLDFNGPVAIRFPRGEALDIYEDNRSPVIYGKSEILKRGMKIAVVAVGACVKLTEEIDDILLENGYDATIINARFIKPIDSALLDDIAKKHDLIVTLEENVLTGGYGQSVLSYINEKGYAADVLNIGLKDSFIEHGDVGSLWKANGLDGEIIANKILKRIKH